MKNHIVFKFLAILLCAATLLTAAAGAVGIFALNETGLYYRTFDEAYNDYMMDQLERAGQEIAERYTAQELGGLSYRMQDAYFGPYRFLDSSFLHGRMGYVLKDGEGNVLQHQQLHETHTAQQNMTVGIDAVAYPRVVMVEPQQNEETVPVVTYSEDADGAMVYDAVPPEGAQVDHITISYPDSSEGVGSPEGVGWLSHDETGHVIFVSHEPHLLDIHDRERIIAMHFTSETMGVLFEASDPNGVGLLHSSTDGFLNFESNWVNPDFVSVVTDPSVFIEVTLAPTEAETDAVEYNGFSSGANIYSAPNEDAEVLGTVPVDAAYETLTPYDINGREWYLTEEGWIQSEPVFVETGADTGEASAWQTVDETPFYATPNAEGVPLDTLPAGTLVEVIRQAEVNGESWALTQQGWVKTELFTQADPAVPQTAAEEIPADTAEEEETLPQETAAGAEAAVAEASEEVMKETVVPEAIPTPYAEASETALPENLEWLHYREDGENMVMGYVLEVSDPYTVEFTLAENALAYEFEWVLLGLVYKLKDQLFPAVIASALLFVILFVYLCCAAGRRPGTDVVRAGGLNRIPLDGLFAGVCVALAGTALLGVEGFRYLLSGSAEVALAFALAAAYGASLLTVWFCFAFAAQVKTPDGFWWRNSLCGWAWKLFVLCLAWAVRAGMVVWGWFTKFCRWLAHVLDEKLLPLMVRFCRAVWKFTVALAALVWKWVCTAGALLKKGWDWLLAWVVRFIAMLPMTWQWLLTGFAIIILLALTVNTGTGFWGICITIAMVLYGTHAFGTLLEAVKHMNKGDLERKVDDKLLVGSFREFAGELNGLADVAVVAAQKQLKSERMKTELITNVSHDIKTPLTSIINYVDLLEKPHTPEEQEVYLEVLSRQSNRLKKLIEDLMEMSKASTGNMSVDIRTVDAVEAVNQALGEFADKLDKAELIPVFRQPEAPVLMQADGRLVWRVMSNLLGNAVKYALPGTRLYIDLASVEGKVVLSMKNISREELNVNADELLERFVRGDASRNTEGSGLGLNIAQSLMELQKGQLQLLVDGDLFKVTLIFPEA